MIKKTLYAAKYLFLLSIIVCQFLSQTASAVVTRQSIAVPAYEYPTLPLWDDIESAGSQIPFVVANPNSGPGASTNPDYTAQINRNTANSTRTIGYLDTNYQSRPIADVIADVDLWRALYPGITGLMLDRIDDATSAQTCYLSAVYNYIKATKPNDLVVDNYGTHIANEAEPYGDIFITGEGDATTYLSTWTQPGSGFEADSANQNRLMHIVYDADAATYPSVLAKMRASDIGWVYITDDVLPNPYDGAVSYWNTEVSDVATLPPSLIPNRGPSNVPTGCIDLQSAVSQNAPGPNTPTSSLLNANLTIDNDAAAEQIAYSSSRVAFTLPAGVTLASASGTSWTCAGNSCTYAANLAPGVSSTALAAQFTTDCSFTSGSIDYSITGFNNQVFDTGSLAVQPPACPNGTMANATLAETGGPLSLPIAIGAGMLALGMIIKILPVLKRNNK